MENSNTRDFLNPNPTQLEMSKTEPLDSWGGLKLWNKAYILRLDPNTQIVVPLEVFADPTDGRILTNTLPPEIREYYETNHIHQNQPPTQDPSSILWGDEIKNKENNFSNWGAYDDVVSKDFNKDTPFNQDLGNWGEE